MGRRLDRDGKPLPIRSREDLETETREALAHLRDHAQQAKAVIDLNRAKIAAAYRDDRLSPAGRRDAARVHQLAAQEQAQALAAQTKAALATLAEAHQRARASTGGGSDPSAQLLAFQQMQDGWQRAQRYLAAGLSLPQVIERAGKEGDAGMLAGLRHHLPSELAEQDRRDPSYSRAMLDMLAQAEAPHLGDVERAVREQEAQLAQLASAVKWNENVLATAANHPFGDPGVGNLIGPDRSVVAVAPEPAGIPRV